MKRKGTNRELKERTGYNLVFQVIQICVPKITLVLGSRSYNKNVRLPGAV